METLKKVGAVKIYSSNEIGSSRIGIGFEKLDRGAFDPEKAYDPVAATGAKWIRLQSGWARTETKKGIYSFQWLDSIVDNLLKRGMTPWLCLCYGNSLYTPEAAEIFGAVGYPPQTPEAAEGWSNYVTETVRHFKGRIAWYEVWNEPDGVWCWKTGVDGTEYGELVKRTAAAVKAGDPDAKIIGGCQCLFELEWLSAMLATGAGKVLDAFSYHNYAVDETFLPHQVQSLYALAKRYNQEIKLIQGETGAQSRSDSPGGALSGGAWTQLKQAKYMVRHTITDFMSNVMFSSYFSCLDMMEALNGRVGDKASRKDFGYFGILSAEFDDDGVATGVYTPKTAYRTLQVLASVFKEDFDIAVLPVQLRSEFSRRLLGPEEPPKAFSYAGFQRKNGSCAFAYWKPTDLLTDSFESTVSIDSVLPGKPRIVDLLDGTVYEIPEPMIKRETPTWRDTPNGAVEIPGNTASKNLDFLRFVHLPVKDYPLLLTFGDFFDWEKYE